MIKKEKKMTNRLKLGYPTRGVLREGGEGPGVQQADAGRREHCLLS